MKKALIFYIVLLVAIGIELVADVFLKESGVTNTKFLLAGMLLYGCTAIPVAFLFKKTDFEVLFVIWQAFGIILGLAVATFYFRETFTASKTIALLFSMGTLICAYL